jgi:hypothetical protein
LPSVSIVTAAPDWIADPKFRFRLPAFGELPTDADRECFLSCAGTLLPLAVDLPKGFAPALLLPLDKLFKTRMDAAHRLWQALSHQRLTQDRSALTRQHRDRLVTALRALDARLQQVSYHAIADQFFDLKPMRDAEWQSHELRGRTVRLCRQGRTLMNGGYRSLLLYPYRRRP